jgi:hypothetical protein
MTTLVDDAKEVNHISFRHIVQVKRKRFGATAGKSMWTRVITTLPPDNLANLTGHAFAKRTGEGT